MSWEDSVPGRETGSAKAPKRENRAHRAWGGSWAQSLESEWRSVGPGGERRVKRHAKASGLHPQNAAEPLGVVSMGVSTDRFPV